VLYINARFLNYAISYFSAKKHKFILKPAGIAIENKKNGDLTENTSFCSFKIDLRLVSEIS